VFSEIQKSQKEAVMIIARGLREVVRDKDIRYAPSEKWPARYKEERVRIIHSDREVILVLDNFYSEFLDFAMDYFRSKPSDIRSLRDKKDRLYIFHFEKEKMRRFQTTPDGIDYLFTFGSALMGHGLYSHALSRFQEILESNPDDYEALLRLSECLTHMRQDELALRHLKTAVSLNPDDAKAYLELAQRYKDLGLHGMALKSLLRARDLGQAGCQIHNDIAAACCELEEYDRAIEAYEKALEDAPRSEITLRNIGSLYQKLGQFDKAIEVYETYLELNPEQHFAHLLLGGVYEEMDDLPRAIEAYQRAVHIRPNYPAYMSLGRIHEKLERTSDARASYQKALEIYPSDKQARDELFRLDHPDIGDLKEEMAKVVNEHPFLQDDPDALPVIYEEAKRRRAEREGGEPGLKRPAGTFGLN
jgi:tetratricopeptide (TPR) repeat protein